MQETQVQPLDWEGSLDKKMANPYSCLEYPMDRGAWWATVHGSQRAQHDWATEQARTHAYVCVQMIYFAV